MSRALSLAIALALLAPVFAAVATVHPSTPWAGPTSEGTGAWAHVWGLYGGHWVRSAGLAGVATVLALALGVPAGVAVGQRRPGLFTRLLDLPLLVPGISLAVGIIALYGAIRSLPLLLAAHVMVVLPLVVRTVAAATRTAGLSTQVEQARVLGCGPAVSWWRVGLPPLRPAIIASALMAAAVSWGEFNITFLLATPDAATFPTALYLTFTTNSLPVGGAALALFLLPVLPVALAAQAVGKRRVEVAA